MSVTFVCCRKPYTKLLSKSLTFCSYTAHLVIQAKLFQLCWKVSVEWKSGDHKVKAFLRSLTLVDWPYGLPYLHLNPFNYDNSMRARTGKQKTLCLNEL